MHPRMTHETGRWSLRWSCSCCDHPVPCVWQRVCHHHRGSIALRAGGHANPRPSILDATIPRTATRSFFQTIKRTDFSLSAYVQSLQGFEEAKRRDAWRETWARSISTTSVLAGPIHSADGGIVKPRSGGFPINLIFLFCAGVSAGASTTRWNNVGMIRECPKRKRAGGIAIGHEAYGRTETENYTQYVRYDTTAT